MLEYAKKVGIMGGTFDPIHYGHLMIAENALQQFDLDYVLFIPAGSPPHKVKNHITDSSLRYSMVQEAIADNPKFLISDMEISRKELSYTYLTLEELKSIYPNIDFFFIMGADSLFDFEKWVYPDKIASTATIIVAVRDLYDTKELDLKIRHLQNKWNVKMYLLNTPNFSISSHDIRNRIKNKMSVKYQLPDEVINFIENNRLYLD